MAPAVEPLLDSPNHRPGCKLRPPVPLPPLPMKGLRIALACALALSLSGCQSLLYSVLYPIGEFPAERPLQVIDGFAIERVYHVPIDEQGSWVSLTVDPKGRLIASDQDGDLYRITPFPIGGVAAATRVEKLDVDVGHAHGLLYAFDSLYVVVNKGLISGGDRNGLYRLRDTNGDDRFDEVRSLRLLEGQHEHGPHQLVVAPDGESLFFIAGNQAPPTRFSASRVPQVWQEDRLLSVIPNRMILNLPPPGAWVARIDPDAEQWELYAAGLRNPYDIAFNRAGDLFAFDADMEWDVGAPWYRPTRLNHVVSGVDYGWRKGSAKWPDYYPDSLGSVVDVGTGSPTGIAFGYGAAFPARYREALYLLDWSHGKIYAAHLTAQGASYTAEIEPFVTGQPLPVTDVVVNPVDGALYFTTGGRRAESNVYRITYVGDENTAPRAASANSTPMPAAEQRRALEKLHAPNAAKGVAQAWPQLTARDRTLRQAARVALEHQPVSTWRDRALGAQEFDARVGALLALARLGERGDRDRALEALLDLDAAQASKRQRVDWLRAVSLWLARHQAPNATLHAKLSKRLSAIYPAKTFRENRELSELLVFLEAPGTIASTLALLNAAPTQQEKIHYAYVLAHVEHGWTLEQRAVYFAWLESAVDLPGGAALAYFIEKIEALARDQLSLGERLELATASKPDTAAAERAAAPRAAGPGRAWTLAELEPTLRGDLAKRDFEQGEAMFQAGACFSCHRFDGRGGATGPDLTSVGSRFRAIEIGESIIDPSRVVSDQYRATTLHMKDGSSVYGRVVNQSGRIMTINTNMLSSEQSSIDARDVERMVPSERSMMPRGLIDTMNENEVLDLLAYLISGGDAEHPAFH